MAGIIQVALSPTSYVALGTGPMYISASVPIALVGGTASAPASNVSGLGIRVDQMPFLWNIAEPVWAISLGPPTAVGASAPFVNVST